MTPSSTGMEGGVGREGRRGEEEEGVEEEGERYCDLRPSILGCSRDSILAVRIEIESSLTLSSDSREVILV